MASHCQFYTKQLVGWVEPPGPAFGRPDDKLRGWARICPASKRYPSTVFCEEDGFREELNPSCALRLRRCPVKRASAARRAGRLRRARPKLRELHIKPNPPDKGYHS